MQKDVKTMKNTMEKGSAFVLRNLRYGGIALTLTAALLVAARPSEITVLLAPYSGDPLVLSGIFATIGIISTLFGYALKR